jgi:hypothetical protein
MVQPKPLMVQPEPAERGHHLWFSRNHKSEGTISGAPSQPVLQNSCAQSQGESVSCHGNTTCFPSKTGVVSRGDQRVTSLRPARYTACSGRV